MGPGGAVLLRLVAYGLILLSSQELPVLVREDFQKGSERWEFSDPQAWKVTETPRGKILSLFERTTPKTPHKGPLGMALLREVTVGDFVLEADLQSPVKKHPLQGLCLIFGYQDNDHFYYSHLARKTDKNHNQVFIVNGADRAMISLRTSEGTDWSDDWVRVKVVRKVADGTIEIYWEDMKTPVQTAQSKTFTWGRIGLGSVDDLGNFADVVLRGTRSGPDPK